MTDVVQTSVEDMALLSPYVIARNKACGLELLRISLRSGEEVVPIFSSGEMAGRFLLSGVLEEGWRVRGCSIGEMVSLLFGPCADIKRVLLNPFPESLAVKDELVEPVYRESFIASLLRGAGNYTES